MPAHSSVAKVKQGTPYSRLATKGGEKSRLVVGGYALAFHGYPRYTKDIDFWVWVNEENAKNLVKTLREFGFSSLGLNEDDFLSPECILKSRVQILIL